MTVGLIGIRLPYFLQLLPSCNLQVNFGGNQARFSLFLNLLDQLKMKANLCIGMSILMRKQIFEHAGGKINTSLLSA
jgi:hypothetical protein